MGAVPVEVGLYTHISDLPGESETLPERTRAPFMLYHLDRNSVYDQDLETRWNDVTSTSSLALAHFDSHITNHSHITVLAHSMFTRTLWPDHSHITALAHYDRTTRTFRLTHNQALVHSMFTRKLWPDHSHITALAHYDRTTRTFRLTHNQALVHSMFTRTLWPDHSHITALAHYDRTTRTFRLTHNQSLAHFMLTRTLWPDHSHIITGPFAHNQSLAHHCSLLELEHFDSHITNHSHITVVAHFMFTRTLWLDHLHITVLELEHSMFTRTFRLSHSMFTRTFRHAHNQSLAHRPTRTFHVHSHISTRT